MDEIIGELIAPTRLMITPGPCSIDSRVYRAMSTPLVGHMDPWFTEMVTTEVQVLLRRAFQTQNRVTQAERLFLARVTEMGHIADFAYHVGEILLAFVLEKARESRRVVEMIFDGVFAAAGDDDDVLDA